MYGFHESRVSLSRRRSRRRGRAIARCPTAPGCGTPKYLCGKGTRLPEMGRSPRLAHASRPDVWVQSMLTCWLVYHQTRQTQRPPFNDARLPFALLPWVVAALTAHLLAPHADPSRGDPASYHAVQPRRLRTSGDAHMPRAGLHMEDASPP